MSDSPAAVFRRIAEAVLNSNNLDAIDDLVAEDYFDHDGGEVGRERYRERIESVRRMFADLHMTIEDTIEEGDKAAVRFTVSATHVGEFMGVAVTEKRVSWQGTGIIRVTDGKMAERWNVSDMIGLLSQIQD